MAEGAAESSKRFTLRRAGPDDAAVLADLILELSDYERLRHEAAPDVDALRRHLEGDDAGRCGAFLAEETTTGRAVGFALYFLNYSTFLTRWGVYLEDLYVQPAWRGLGAGFALAQGAGYVLLAAGVTPGPVLATVVSLVAVQGVGLLGVSGLYLWLRDRDLVGVGVPDLRELIFTASGYALVMGGYFVVVFAVVAAGIQPAQNNIAGLAQGAPELLLLLIPASFLIIGPGEELLFRGVVQGRLRQAFSAPVAIALASVIFGAIHIFAITGPTSGKFVYVAIVAVLALVLGTTYELTDNIVVPSLIHGAYNATLFGLAYVALKFAPESARQGGEVAETVGVLFALLA